MVEHKSFSNSAPLRRDEIYTELKELVLSCKLRPGTKLYEQDLAQQFGVSKSPVRDALHRLQMEGLVEVLPRKGYRVQAISLEDALELYEMRMLLERACIERSCRSASDSSLRALDRYRSGPSGPKMQQWLAYDRDFHAALAARCGNDRLIRTTQSHLQAFERLLCASVTASGRGRDGHRLFQRIVHEHSAIIDAAQARNERKAASLIRTHIETSRKRFLDSFAGGGNRIDLMISPAANRHTSNSSLLA